MKQIQSFIWKDTFRMTMACLSQPVEKQIQSCDRSDSYHGHTNTSCDFARRYLTTCIYIQNICMCLHRKQAHNQDCNHCFFMIHFSASSNGTVMHFCKRAAPQLWLPYQIPMEWNSSITVIKPHEKDPGAYIGTVEEMWGWCIDSLPRWNQITGELWWSDKSDGIGTPLKQRFS